MYLTSILLNLCDLDLHLQGYLCQKPLKLGHFGAYLHDQLVNVSPMTFKLCANRVHVGMFNISSGLFKIQKLKILTEL